MPAKKKAAGQPAAKRASADAGPAKKAAKAKAAKPGTPPPDIDAGVKVG